MATSPDDEPKVLYWAKWLPRIAWVLRKIKLEWIVWNAREAATLGILRQFHFDVLHRMQRLAKDVSHRERELESASTLALQICTEYRRILGTFLELPDCKLHCCFKLMAPPTEISTEDRVATWVRSEPLDTRPVEDGIEYAHTVDRNSVWAAMLGRNDGKTSWDRFRSFSCNDLIRHSDFRCDRQDWQRYYRSTFVVPIRYPANRLGTDHCHLGFVAFDSPLQSAFRGLPDIFNYREDPTGYSERLESSAAFHLVAMLADILGSFLGPAMNGKES